MLKRGEITESDKKAMRPKSVKISRAHGLPKTHKHYECLPKLKPIIDTTDTPYYGTSKFLSHPLNPLIENEYLVQDPFVQPKRLEEYLKNYLKMAKDLSTFDEECLFRVYL